MRRLATKHIVAITIVLFLPLCLVRGPTATADVDEGGRAAAEKAPVAEETQKEAPAGEADQTEQPDEPEKIPLNLKDAGIEQVIKFISDHTGKVILKQKDVEAQITLASPEPVTPDRAVELIYNALALEGVAVVEQDGVIHLMPEDKAAKLGMETRTFDVKFADVQEVQKLVKPLLGDETKFMADTRSNKAIVTGAPDVLDDLQDIIQAIDVLELEGTQMHIFQLKHAEASEIEPVLKAVLTDDGKGKKESKSGEEAPVAVVAYPSANWIVVRAPKEKLEAARQLVEQLDKQKPPELDLNVVMIKHADAADLARRLSELFRKRPRSRELRETVVLTADERSNALIVMSTEENFGLITKILAQLDTEESRKTETRSYTLEYADAGDVAGQLNDLYSGTSQSQYSYYYSYYRSRSRQDQPQFVAERRTNSLIVIAPPNSFDDIEALIQKLDQPIDTAEVSPRIYHIENVDAKEMTDVLNEVFGTEESEDRGGYYYYYFRARGGTDKEVGRLYGKVRFVHEPNTNSVIVITNNSENFAIIEDILLRLDKAMPEYANTMVYELENAEAVEVADQLNTLFAPPGGGRGRKGDEDAEQAYYSWLLNMRRGGEEERPISNLIGNVRVVPDPRINALLITTAVQNFGVLKELIEKLDVESPKVLLRVRLIEVTRSEEDRVGTRWTSDSTIFETDDFNNGLLSNLGVNWEQVTTDTVLTAGFDVSALVQFLEREFDARIVSEPTMAVNNNRRAELFVGSQVPFITETQREPGTTARNDSFEYREVGTKLVITPHINKNNMVVTEVEVEASQIRPGEVLFGGFILDTRNFDSELAVEDGQTIVIGGIFRQEESETMHRVPILGHIPLVKLLFSKKDTIMETTELIAFITPDVMRNAAQVDDVTRREKERLEDLQQFFRPGRTRSHETGDAG